MAEPATVIHAFSLEMQDTEVVARAFAAAEARRLGEDVRAFTDANWTRWINHAHCAIRDLDAERLRRALFSKGDIAKALVTAEAMSVDAAAYAAVLKP
jgi:predicted NAD-dependent protein-ADP-ribosyltransferase YbiA (DUF1768 family)